MEKMFNWISVAAGCIGGVAAKIWGGWDTLLYVLVGLIVIDYLTGLIKAVYTKQLSSEIGFKGLCKKVMILLVVAMSNLIEMVVGDSLAVREIVTMFFIANEGLSLLENAAVVYPGMPQKLKDILLQLRDKGNGGGTDDEAEV